jgi:hypothetical protein
LFAVFPPKSDFFNTLLDDSINTRLMIHWFNYREITLQDRYMYFGGAIAIVLLAASSVRVQAAEGEVIGDSLGVGVGWASKLPSHAKISVSIQSGAILEQLRQARRGDTVFMSLGTNDAVSGALNVKGKVESIVKTANELGVKLVWIGPPCVMKSWDVNSGKLDSILREQLAGTSVTYVGMRSEGLCDRSIRAPDGVHFSMEGYSRMWRKAAEAAGVSVAGVQTEESKGAHEGQRHIRSGHRHRRVHVPAAQSRPTKVAN